MALQDPEQLGIHSEFNQPDHLMLLGQEAGCGASAGSDSFPREPGNGVTDHAVLSGERNG